MWPAPDHTRLVFDISGPVDHTLFTLDDPQSRGDRCSQESSVHHARNSSAGDNLVARIRSAPRNQRDLRMVSGPQAAGSTKELCAAPQRHLWSSPGVDSVPKRAAWDAWRESAPGRSSCPPMRDVVIAIDAGHGGDDPGRSDRGERVRRTSCSKVAKRLQALVKREPGMRPSWCVRVTIMSVCAGAWRSRVQIGGTCSSPYMPMRSRTRGCAGSSVYVLSRTGASSEAARWLAEQENASDFVGGVSSG